MKQINKKHLFFLIPIGIFAIVMLVLECLPDGVQMRFAYPDSISGNIINVYEYYPYFSDMPFGYGNFCPVIIGILTIAVIILWIVNLFLDKRGIDVAILVMTILKFVFSAVELIFSQTAINWAMFALSFVLAIYCIAKAAINKEFAKIKKPRDTIAETENK